MASRVKLCCALAAALTLSIAFSSSQRTSAATFTVDSAGDASDVAPGDGTCADSSGTCTVRVTIQEANIYGGFGQSDTINFSVTSTINLTGALPDMTSNMTLNGPSSSLLTVRRHTGGDNRILFTN